MIGINLLHSLLSLLKFKKVVQCGHLVTCLVNPLVVGKPTTIYNAHLDLKYHISPCSSMHFRNRSHILRMQKVFKQLDLLVLTRTMPVLAGAKPCHLYKRGNRTICDGPNSHFTLVVLEPSLSGKCHQ